MQTSQSGLVYCTQMGLRQRHTSELPKAGLSMLEGHADVLACWPSDSKRLEPA